MIHRHKDGRVTTTVAGFELIAGVGDSDPASMTMWIKLRRGFRPLGLFPVKQSGIWWRRGVIQAANRIAPLADTVLQRKRLVTLYGMRNRGVRVAQAVAFLLRESHRKECACPQDVKPAIIGRKGRGLLWSKVRRIPWE